MTKQIKSHPQFDQDDYSYLRGKGWTNAQIVARWNEENKAGNGPCRWTTAFAKTKLAAVAA